MAAKKASGAGVMPAPLEQAYILRNGRAIRFVMPDLFAFASGKADIPNQAQAEIYRLIYGTYAEPPPEQQFIYDQRYMRSLFYIAQLVIAPRVRLEADEEGEIDVRELTLPDLMACFSFFRYGPSLPLSNAESGDAGAGAAPASTGDDVPQGTE